MLIDSRRSIRSSRRSTRIPPRKRSSSTERRDSCRGSPYPSSAVVAGLAGSIPVVVRRTGPAVGHTAFLVVGRRTCKAHYVSTCA